MIDGATTLERAFQLARSAEVESISDIMKRLKFEGYSIDQLDGKELRKQLTGLIKTSKSG